MRQLKQIMLGALAASVLTAFGTGTASATTLEIGGVPQNNSVSITASLKSGTSTIMRDTFFISAKTCTQSHLALATESPFTGTKVTGKISSLSFSGCENTITVHNAGALAFEWTSGTNARVYWESAHVTTFSSIHNTYITCTIPDAGILIGTLTGVKEGHATIHINATINCGDHLSSKKWTGTYTVTSPTGLGAVS